MRPTDPATALTLGQMAKALRIGGEGAIDALPAPGPGVPTATDPARKHARRVGATITLGMLVAGALATAHATENRRESVDFGRPPASATAARGSIPRPAAAAPGPVRAHASADRGIQAAAPSQEQSKMLSKLSGAAAATAVGVSATVAGAENHVLVMPSPGSGITIEHADAQNEPIVTGAMTIEFWVKYAGSQGRILSKRGCSYEGYTIALEPENESARVVIGFGTGYVELGWIGGVIPRNEWHHVAFIWNRSAGSLRFVVDGSTRNETITSANQVPGIESNPLQFGEQCGWGVVGSMDNVRIWNVARSDAEISALAHRSISASEAPTHVGLVGSWNFEDQIAVVDQRGLSGPGTFYGSATTAAEELPHTTQCRGDLYVDGFVNGADLGALLAYWGPVTGTPASQAADIDRDGVVNGSDLGILLAGWGACGN